jgi:dTDP-4-dehydrorhamnose reductase
MLRLLEDRSAPGGVFHFANAGETTWHGVAAHVFAAAAAFGRRAPELKPIATADYPTPARRPANSRLDASRFSAAYGLAPRPWREAVDGIVAALLQEQPT